LLSICLARRSHFFVFPLSTFRMELGARSTNRANSSLEKYFLNPEISGASLNAFLIRRSGCSLFGFAMGKACLIGIREARGDFPF